MSDPRNTLQAKFEPGNRIANFGNVLIRMHVKGFRCHQNTVVEVQSPITAFCGLNGTGKSTLLQLLAVAYRRPGAAKSYYVKDFLVIGPLDPAPFADSAEVEYKYWRSTGDQQTVTVSRRAQTQHWSGYTRRPTREVYFAGIGHYLPRIEQRDFVVRNAKNLQITGQQDVPRLVKDAAAQILGCNYSAVTSKSVTYSRSTGEIVAVDRWGVEYSETHMGFGEGRTQSLVLALEKLLDKSLVLIEEPETSLHPSAQHSLARYLMDVSIRKGHQIFITTHSEYLLKALPAASRIYLTREAASVRCVTGLSAAEAASLMTEGHTRALAVLVEDECGRAVLRELLRRIDPAFLETVGIYVGGDADILARTVRVISETGLAVAAVRDGDQAEDAEANLFKLPGTQAPERELFGDDLVKEHVQQQYGVNVNDFLAGLGSVDHHGWIGRLAERVNLDADALLMDLARAYARSIPENELASLRDVLREAVK